MRQERTEVLVIGGGATGTGVLRDLAMRGFDALLVEQRDLSHGTTGRYHGLLHSGGRYVVKDPEAAVECIEENRVLRRIMPHCIEDTSGFFVTTPEDDLAYLPRFMEGCAKAGIPCRELAVAEALRREPYLNPDISHCLEVPDAAADSFLATISTAASAREHGARVLPYHQVETLIRSGDRVVGARCHDLVKDEEVEISADLVVNASGAWAGRIAATAGINFQVLSGKGTMIAVNHRMINTVLNRCKMPSDGDIIVPIRTVAVIGTTDEGVPDPERFSVEPWEVRRMLDDPACEMQSTTPDLEACEAADDHTIVLRSRTPAPLFLEQLAAVPIIHRSAGDLPVGGFDLAHQIGADVGGLGVDAAAEPREDGDQRAPEGQADEIVDRGRLRVVEPTGQHPVVTGDAEQAEADDEQAGDRAGAEGDVERRLEPRLRGLRGPHVRPDGDVHPDEAGGGREGGADQEADRGAPAELVVEAEEEEGDDRNGGDRHVLAPQVGGRALLDRTADLLHPLAALRLLEHPRGEPDPDRDAERGRGERECDRMVAEPVHRPP